MMLRVIAAVSFLSTAAAAIPLAQAEDVKLGFVDLQRALGETEDGRRAKANLQKVLDQKQKELNEQQEDLKKAMDDLQKKRSLLAPDVLRAKESELQERFGKLQAALSRNQQELDQKQNEAIGKIMERMQRIIGRVAATENLTMVFERNQAGLVFSKPHLDLTNELIRRYNSGEGADASPASAVPAKPAAAKK